VYTTQSTKKAYPTYLASILYVSSTVGKLYVNLTEGTIIETETYTGFIRGILRGVRYAKSLRVLFLHRRSPSWTTLVLYSRAVLVFNEPTIKGQSKTDWNSFSQTVLVWALGLINKKGKLTDDRS
jgi:hypothetical protein